MVLIGLFGVNALNSWLKLSHCLLEDKILCVNYVVARKFGGRVFAAGL